MEAREQKRPIRSASATTGDAAAPQASSPGRRPPLGATQAEWPIGNTQHGNPELTTLLLEIAEAANRDLPPPQLERLVLSLIECVVEFVSLSPLQQDSGLLEACERAGQFIERSTAPFAESNRPPAIEDPRIAENAVDDIGPPNNDEKLRRAHTVLVVDDEPAVRRVATRMLNKSGFDVIAADGGAAAVALLADPSIEIGAVLLDAMMPAMNGEATFHALRELRADIPIVLCTGHSEFDARQMLVGKTRATFLQKPFTITSLVERVRDAIGLDAWR